MPFLAVTSHADHLHENPDASGAAQHINTDPHLFFSFPRAFKSFSSFPR